MTAETHDGLNMECAACQAIRARRAVLLTRALHAPKGLTRYQYTRGMTKADALLFWVDAKALGFIVVGEQPSGGRLFALPSVEVPA